ncbi:MAG TPA: hypothetical protein P5571_12670 [Candidatus Krumholzibacteria bacterium]|nr:hypothetical protein [Candidatus Krumholzibacteria bacterium]HRX52215.1 hypothetical protein [Candidatus Krumholzibacteria bacterium]
MLRRFSILAAALCLSAATAAAFSSGPLDGLTNAPGEGNCTGCHADFPLNSGTGVLDIVNIPSAYDPDTTYDLTVSLSDPAAQRWGFEMTVLDGTDTFTGTLATTDVNTQTSTGGVFGRTYIKHTSAGTNNGQTGSNTWTVRWTSPPAGSGDVTFYIAGNAANGNFFNTGDRIYAVALPLAESQGTSVDGFAPRALALQSAPNPFNPRTELAFTLADAAPVRLTVHALDGRRVAVLHEGLLEAGTHRVPWTAVDETGRRLPSGTYLGRIATPTGTGLVRMTLVK